MVVGAAGDQVEAAGKEALRQGGGVGHSGTGVAGEARLGRLPEGHRDGGGRVVVGPSLEAGEHRPVEGRGVLGPAQEHGAAGATESLVGRGRDDGGVRDG